MKRFKLKEDRPRCPACGGHTIRCKKVVKSRCQLCGLNWYFQKDKDFLKARKDRAKKLRRIRYLKTRKVKPKPLSKKAKEEICRLVCYIRATAYRAGKDGDVTAETYQHLLAKEKEIQALLHVPEDHP